MTRRLSILILLSALSAPGQTLYTNVAAVATNWTVSWNLPPNWTNYASGSTIVSYTADAENNSWLHGLATNYWPITNCQVDPTLLPPGTNTIEVQFCVLNTNGTVGWSGWAWNQVTTPGIYLIVPVVSLGISPDAQQWQYFALNPSVVGPFPIQSAQYFRWQFSQGQGRWGQIQIVKTLYNPPNFYEVTNVSTNAPVAQAAPMPL